MNEMLAYIGGAVTVLTAIVAALIGCRVLLDNANNEITPTQAFNKIRAICQSNERCADCPLGDRCNADPPCDWKGEKAK